MNAHDILDMIGDAKGTYVWDAQQTRSGNIPSSGKKLVSKKLWLIAAILSLILLLVGCAIVYVLNLQDMKIGENTVTEPEHYGANWVVIEAKEKTYEHLSVQGFADSPNQQAVREYRDYLDSINRDTVTDEEKAAKRREIAEKYGLKLLSEGISIHYLQGDALPDKLQFANFCTEQPYAQMHYVSGGFHREGNFRIHLNIEPVDGLLDWPYFITVEYRYYEKEYFVYDYISVEYLDSFQEWEYTMPDGKLAHLALGKEDALIIAERENGTFCVNFDSRTGIDTIDKGTLEKIADLFDFSFVPYLTDAEMLAAETKLEQIEELQHQQSLAQQAQWEASLKKEGFADWVRQTLEGKSYDEVIDLGYAFHDIDGNGIDDLLIGRDGYCTAIYWEVNGETVQFTNAAALLFPCEDQTIGYTLTPFDTNYYFTHVDHGTSKGVANIKYDPGRPDGEYRKGDLEHWNRYDIITKEEFDSIMNSYVRIPITFLPLTEYPLDDSVQLEDKHQVFTDSAESYEDIIRMRLTSKEEQWPRWKYDIRDLNDDGMEELIWSEDGRIWIYTTVDGAIISYNMVCDGTMRPCEDGIVEAIQHYGPVNKTYRYYRLEKDEAVLVDYLRYDVDRDPENPWFRSPDLTGQDITLEPISEMEARSIIASYDSMEIDMKPISDYPF